MAEMNLSRHVPPVAAAHRGGQQRNRSPQEEARRQAHRRPREHARDVALVMGIPAAEMTPRVQEALLHIMHEFDRQRYELEDLREHMGFLEATADSHSVLPVMSRRALVRELGRIIAHGEHAGVANTFVLFRVGNLDEIRDRLDRAAAVAALTAVAETLRRAVRGSDVIGGLGGGDFGLVLTVTDGDHAAGKAWELNAALAGRTAGADDDGPVAVDVSYGIHAIEPGDGATSVIDGAERDRLDRLHRDREPAAADAKS